jgi:hypothetical protein
MKELFVLSYILFLALLIRATFLNQIKYRLYLKLITCLHYLALGVYALLHHPVPLLKYLLVMGLIFSFIGDLFLGLKHRIKIGFLLGLGAFSIAQLYYLLYLQISNFNYIPFILSILFMFIFWKYIKDSPKFEFTHKSHFLMIYIYLLSSTFFSAIFNLYTSYNIPNLILTIGFSTFFISDITLFHVYFLKAKINFLKIVYLFFYHLAQILIAYFMWL